MDTAGTSQFFDVLRIDDLELETEFLVHFDTPLLLKRRRTHDQYGTRTMAQEQLLNDETGFDGLSETDIVGDE